MSARTFEWTVDGEPFEGFAVANEQGTRPAVLVFHAWAGRGPLEAQWAETLADLGYVGVAADVYGKGKLGTTKEEKQALMGPLLADRAQLERRLLGALEAVRRLPDVDAGRVAAIGFCFGGLCAFDLARCGADVRGVVGFHGLFHPRGIENERITAKVLALHGYDDPMAPPPALVAFCDEMTAAGVDWQVHAYGGTMHAFTNPEARDPELGTVYHPVAGRRARRAMTEFLAEVLL